MNVELLFNKLFFGFAFFDTSLLSLLAGTASAGLPSPNVGSGEDSRLRVFSFAPVEEILSSLLFSSPSNFPAFLEWPDFSLSAVSVLCNSLVGRVSGAEVTKESLVPLNGRFEVDTRGLELATRLSDG